ncbi:MAG: colanic acid biosynthesis acetyltransferase WcaF [Leptolyngbyaceae cyanobacterium SM2_5_2]|nr:colanic acid biosynthesis acetyltransferase WcaF [Leptolyngbyaceae cyanobacterium SM2_5_2]
MRLDQYSLGSYKPGAPLWRQLLWYFVGLPLLRAYWLPMSAVKVALLRAFGATVGQGVRIKPGVRVKFPWRLTVGDHVWIGEETWIDNLDVVTIESHVCLSQGVYLCTGNHDWSHPHFSLRTGSIYLRRGCWLAARSVVGPGVTVGQGAILALGSVAGRSLTDMTIYAGNPAQPVKTRVMAESPGLD